MAVSSYDQSLRRLLIHEGGYTNHAADPGGPTNFGITIHDYRKHVKPDATAADIRAMKVEEARAIYRAKYWDAQRCDELPAGVDYAVFDYGVNSGIGRSGKVLRRMLNLPDRTASVTDQVVAAARRVDSRALVAAICDERLHFLQRLKTWPVFGKGWSRRVAEVKATALAMAGSAQVAQPAAAKVGTSVVKSGLQGSVIVVAGAVTAHQAFRWGWQPITIVAIALALVLGAGIGLCWRRRQENKQGASAQFHAYALKFQTNCGETETMWEKIKLCFRNSVTILWARVQVLAGLVTASMLALASDPNVTGAIQTALQPKYVPYYVITIGLITEIARRRTAGCA